ncbi:MAG: thiol:disulfide interchange protein DsbA/DsbL [Pseudomonadota bacterium]|nr:thiol:disulfide interchange protein DsbA/DsbL [Pseudomonadota bacterium]
MKRRDFSKQLTGAGFGLALAGTARAQGAPVEGQQYVRLQTAAPVSLPAPDKKIEVVEFFSYACPHCYAFEPLIEAWAKRLPPDVYFHQVPVGFSAAYQVLQKMYYALEDSGQLTALHRKVFYGIHQQGKHFTNEADMVAFVTASGGDGAKFSNAFKSFGVATKVARAKQLADAYKIDGVPAVGVQGRYYTAASLAGSHERALQVADYLIQRARQPA